MQGTAKAIRRGGDPEAPTRHGEAVGLVKPPQKGLENRPFPPRPKWKSSLAKSGKRREAGGSRHNGGERGKVKGAKPEREETSAAQKRRWERPSSSTEWRKEKRRGESMELSWSLEEREEEGILGEKRRGESMELS